MSVNFQTVGVDRIRALCCDAPRIFVTVLVFNARRNG